MADRPTNGIRIDTIVIHDLESTYDAGVTGLANLTNPASTHFVMSSTGAVTQMVPTKDVAFHSGKYSTNLRSIGIEHEGYAAHGAAWCTEAQYPATAHLVKYLAERFDVPLDRQHIVGHDNVAGPKSALVSGARGHHSRVPLRLQPLRQGVVPGRPERTVHHWLNDGN